MPTHYDKDGDSTIENSAEAAEAGEAEEPTSPLNGGETTEDGKGAGVNHADELAAESASVASVLSGAGTAEGSGDSEEESQVPDEEVPAEDLESFDRALKDKVREEEKAMEEEQASAQKDAGRRKEEKTPESSGKTAGESGESSRVNEAGEELERGDAGEEESIEQMLAEAADDSRPYRHIGKTADDPLADSDSDEDVTSGNYRRDATKRGVYTGGTRKERLMSGDRVETSAERENRGGGGRKGNGTRTLLIILIIVAIAAICAVAYMVLRDKGFGQNDTTAAQETTSAADTTAAAAETSAAAETTAAGSAAETTAAAASVTWAQDSNEQITTLVNSYYAALAGGDTATVQSLVDPSITVDEASVTSQADAVESYQNITTYVADGQNAGEYAVYVSYEIKFVNIATAAPGLVPVYVKTQSDGSLRLIPYANFDSTISTYMDSVSQSDTIQQLAQQVNEAYQTALSSDADLKAYIDSLGSSDTGSTTAASETTAAAQETTAGETTAAQETTTAAEVTFEEVDDIQYTTAQVKLRKEPVLDEDTNDFLLIDKGAWVHVVGVSDKWCKVVTQSGNTGYIYRQYLSEYDPNTEE